MTGELTCGLRYLYADVVVKGLWAMKGPVLAGVAAMATLPVAAAGTVVVALGGLATPAPSALAVADIPAPLLRAYAASAATCPGLSWEVLAAVAKVESDHGRAGGARMGVAGEVAPAILGPVLDGTGAAAAVADTDDGRLDGDATWDRAVGPLQFLPATWARFGRDANGDGVADPHNALDAIASAAGYLCGPTGRVADVAGALRSYNRSDAYVAEVLAVAAGYGAGTAGTSAAAVLANPAIALSGPARADVDSGLVDPRLVAVLAIAGRQYPLAVSVIRTGHSQCVGGGSRAERPTCAISNHWYGRGVDVAAVAGRPVSAANAGARTLVEALLRLPADLRPDELGVPWAALDPLPGVFTDAAHQDHLHLGWSAKAASSR